MVPALFDEDEKKSMSDKVRDEAKKTRHPRHQGRYVELLLVKDKKQPPYCLSYVSGRRHSQNPMPKLPRINF